MNICSHCHGIIPEPRLNLPALADKLCGCPRFKWTLDELGKFHGHLGAAIESLLSGGMRMSTDAETAEHVRQFGPNAVVIGDYVIQKRPRVSIPAAGTE